MKEERDVLINREFYSHELADLIYTNHVPYGDCLIRILTGDVVCARYGQDHYTGCDECFKYHKGCYINDVDFLK